MLVPQNWQCPPGASVVGWNQERHSCSWSFAAGDNCGSWEAEPCPFRHIGRLSLYRGREEHLKILLFLWALPVCWLWQPGMRWRFQSILPLWFFVTLTTSHPWSLPGAPSVFSIPLPLPLPNCSYVEKWLLSGYFSLTTLVQALCVFKDCPDTIQVWPVPPCSSPTSHQSHWSSQPESHSSLPTVTLQREYRLCEDQESVSSQEWALLKKRIILFTHTFKIM